MAPAVAKVAKVPIVASRSSSRVIPVVKPAAVKEVVKKVVESKKRSKDVVEKAEEEGDEDEEAEEDEEEKKKLVAKKAKVVKAAAPKAEAKPKKEVASGDKGVGSIVKDITLKDENGEDVSLASLYEKSGLVIFSYPKANTPGCTNQACGFRDIYDDITATGFQVYGLAEDSPKSHLSWKTGKKLQYSLLSDPKRQLLNALGSTVAKKRCHFIIEKGGKLLEAKLGVKPADSPKQALAFIKAL